VPSGGFAAGRRGGGPPPPPPTAGRWTPRQVAGLAAGLAAFAAVDEITQPLFSRALERLDWVYDCLGIALGLAVVATMCAVVRGCYRQLGVGGR
jgi:hypothetical protein